MIYFNTRNKASVFSAYALLSVVGFGGLWFGAKGGESLSATESFLAFYGFLSTTVVFYMLAGQKASLEHLTDIVTDEASDRSREIEAVYRHISAEVDAVRDIVDDCDKSTKDCCNKAAF